MTVTVYTKPACVQCNATYKALDKQGIAHQTVDITADGDARDYVLALGYLAVRSSWPVTTTGQGLRGRPHQGTPEQGSWKGPRTMSYTTVNDPHQPDAMPMWESLDHATVDDVYPRRADPHPATQPDDRIVDQGTAWMWSGPSTMPSWRYMSPILVIAPSGYVHADPARRSHQADNA